jgi:uncharacterized membrane protein
MGFMSICVCVAFVLISMKKYMFSSAFLMSFCSLIVAAFPSFSFAQTVPNSGSPTSPLSPTSPTGFPNGFNGGGFSSGGFNSGINNGFIGGGFSGGSNGQCGIVGFAGISENLGNSPQVLTNSRTESGSVIDSDSRIGVGSTQSISAQLGVQVYSQKCSDPKEQLRSQERINEKNNETQQFQACIQGRVMLALAGKDPDVACLRR